MLSVLDNLVGFPLDFVVVTRDTRISDPVRGFLSAAYGEMSKEEVCLVFAELAHSISGIDKNRIKKTLEGLPDSPLKRKAIEAFLSASPFLKSSRVPLKRPIVVLFNEMFFGRDIALEKGKVDEILECYKLFSIFFPAKTYLYMNFLYRDNIKSEYGEQLTISKARYRDIFRLEVQEKQFKFASVWFEKGARFEDGPYEDRLYNRSFNTYYLSMVITEVCLYSGLLFNQTKILNQKGEEIGFYNKSSLCKESLSHFKVGSEFKKSDFPFYVIGNFEVVNSSHNQLLDYITPLICYDVSVLLNLPSTSPRDFCLFAANTHTDFVADISDAFKRDQVFKFNQACICADSEGEVGGIGKLQELSKEYTGSVSGVFTPTADILFPLKGIKPDIFLNFSFPGSNYGIYMYTGRE
jgi:hypothetical protein